jgi:hypothetical protein
MFFVFVLRSMFKKFPKIIKKLFGCGLYPSPHVSALRVPTQLVPLDGATLNFWGITQLYEGPLKYKA